MLNILKSKKTLNIILLLISIFVMFIGLPFLLMIILGDNYVNSNFFKIWDNITTKNIIINPLFGFPFILGLISLFVTWNYKSIILKIIYTSMYILFIFFSLIITMGMTSLKDALIFVPHIIMIILHIVIYDKKLVY